MGRSTPAILMAAVLSISLSLTIGRPLAAVDATNFKAGLIISDSVFTNQKAMAVSQIQSFLNGKVPTCDTNGEQLSEYGGPDLNNDGKVQRWEWGKANYNQTTFTCLKNYQQNDKSAAQIIYDTAKEYAINPQVLIVLLQKEQALVTDTWPLKIQYRSATGYGCPDTADCSSEYYGFTNQVDWAAKMFRAIMNDSPTWYTPYELGVNSIPWHPNTGDCGYSSVTIQNRATKALYNYTPYRPNSAALNAGYGAGNSCSSYGNRNFFLYFSDWFGNPLDIVYESMEAPRYMRLTEELMKTSFLTLQPTGSTLSAGQIVYFDTKTTINGVTYLRSQYDRENDLDKGIPVSQLTDITLTYSALPTPRHLRVTQDIKKMDPRTQEAVGAQIAAGQDIYFADSTTINGIEYARSSYDSQQDLSRAIPMTSLADIEIVDMKTPRYMKVISSGNKSSLLTLESDGEPITAGAVLYFDNKVTINGVDYLRTNDDTVGDITQGVSISNLSEIDVKFRPMQTPRYLRTTSALYKIDPKTDTNHGPQIGAGQDILFTELFTLNGVQYLRTAYDARADDPYAIPRDGLAEITAMPMETPRSMKLLGGLRKSSFLDLASIGTMLEKDKVIYFDTKVTINGIVYLQSQFDTTNSLNRGIPVGDLKNI